MSSWYETKPWLVSYDERTRVAAPVAATTMVAAFRRTADRSPDVTAISYFDAHLTYREVDELSNGVAQYLLAQGFTAGDRLAIMLQNIPQFVLALLGAWKAGGIVVPVNPMYRERELEHVLSDAGVRAFAGSQSGWNRLAGVVAESEVRIALTTSELDFQTRDDPRVFAKVRRQATEGAVDLLEVARATSVPPPDPGLLPGDVALISYTSGTSGRPKGATNTHGNVATNAAVMSSFGGLGAGAVLFGLAPLFHITGLVGEIASAIDTGGKLVLAYRFEPGVVLDAFLEHKPTYTVGPSTAYMALMAHPDVSTEHFASFTMLYSGGAALPLAVVTTFRERFGHYIHNGYGLTETTAGCVVVPGTREAPIDPASGTISIGLPMPDTIVRILGEDGREQPPGEAGEIAVEGPMVVPGYWNQPEATAAALPGGRLLTGDIGFMDPDGWVYVVDRKKDMINASGFKVWPREVEDVLYTHPAVREAAVVGVPDDYRGETVKAYVSARPGSTADPLELVAYCKERLAAYKYPRDVVVLDELPKTVSGKILRRELRDRK
ncbi:class I adenylate-forming enzyme family protein [Amycolatopsis sp. H20-H5]|uniref:class I adenylate-forming enzyme family protein n=1 Tax=Amycolatopsis sp. H20-H5 TaxID=3046309 RepID=UPI002DB76631|nr:AMP-binding protein [Amycolatopsis sp. H20-H5]MEC3976111.1 AMP-binding protein [Amycolatopsis sp. H20-H5]